MEQEFPKPSGMQSLRSGIHILNEFSHVSGELTVTELANRLGMPKSQVSRMLAALREEGWVVQNPATRAYSIGIAAYAAGTRFINSNRLTAEALPILRSVVDACGFTSTLSVLEGARPLYLLQVDGSISADFGSRVGSYFPYNATAPGKLLSAFAEEELRGEIFRRGPARFTPHTIVDAAKLRKQLRLIREQGYAVSVGERSIDVGAIAVPVFGAADNFVAAMGIAYPLNLMPEDRFVYYARLLQSRARTLSLRLGASNYPFTPHPETLERLALDGPAIAVNHSKEI